MPTGSELEREVAGRPATAEDRVGFYARHVLPQVPRLLGMIDREPCSVSAGSVDRSHWAWKFKDFPLGMLQTVVYPLAQLWTWRHPTNPYGGNGRLLEWIALVVRETLRRQKRTGAFDGFAPNENDAGPTLGVAHGLGRAARLLGDAFPRDQVPGFLEGYRRACDLGLRHLETHAFVSNHHGLFAVAYLDAAELLDDRRYRERGDEIVDTILARQSADGWYAEYDGPDPGYESLGIAHLAQYWSRTGSPRLLASLERSVEFLAHCVHPDGSIGGAYGSRQTRLYFPSGLEMLAPHSADAAAISAFMRRRLQRDNVVTPAATDAENLVPVMSSYLACCLLPDAPAATAAPLPCEAHGGVRVFQEAQLVVCGAPAYYAVVGAAKGGVCRVHERGTGRLVYEDAGYVAQSGTATWSSQLLGLAEPAEIRGNDVHARTTFGACNTVLPSPAMWVAFRIANLTAFRVRWLGDLLRRWIVHRLIRRRRTAPMTLRRTIAFSGDRIRIEDTLERTGAARVDDVRASRSFLAVHMGSAQYFHASDLETVPETDATRLAREVRAAGRAETSVTLRFGAEARDA